MAKIDRYWKQVHAIESMTGTTSAIARRVVSILRDDRGWDSARSTREHPRIVARLVAEEEARDKEGKPYVDLDDFLDDYGQWDGYYDQYDVETSADY